MFSIAFIGAIFFDYHKKHNVHKAFIFLGAFVAGLLLTACMFRLFGFYFISMLPPGLFIGVLLFKRGKPKPADQGCLS